MTRMALFFSAAVIGLPVQAADLSGALPARVDALGSGLAALWREAHPDSPAPANGIAAAGVPLAGRSSLLLGPAGPLRSSGLGMAPLYRVSYREAALGKAPGFAAQFGVARAATAQPAEIQPNWWSTAATFERGAWRAFATHERAQDGYGLGASDQGWRLGAAYRFGGAQISAGWERLRHDVDAGDARQQAWWIGLAQRVGDGALRINLARSSDASGSLAFQPGGARQLALGYEHGLSAQTAVYAFYTRLSNDPNGLFRLGGGEVDHGMSVAGGNGISLGVRHSF